MILHDLPELTEAAERFVSKDLESMLEESSRGFAAQQAETVWRKRLLNDKNAYAFKLQEVRQITAWALDPRQL